MLESPDLLVQGLADGLAVAPCGDIPAAARTSAPFPQRSCVEAEAALAAQTDC